jgi:metal-responsive CopG/Arc/MetJ family transcriptional regulator
MNKEVKNKKQNISISLHEDIMFLVKQFCKNNKLKKSKFIEDVLKEYIMKNNEK